MATFHTLMHTAAEIDTKLDNILLKTEQTLSEAEKAQVQANLGVPSSEEIVPLAKGGTGTTSVSGILETLGITSGFQSEEFLSHKNTIEILVTTGIATGSSYTAPLANHLYVGIFYTNLLEQRPFIVFGQEIGNGSGILVNIGKYDISFGASSCSVHSAGANDTLTSINATIILHKIF